MPEPTVADRWLMLTSTVLRQAGLRASRGRTAVTEVLARGHCLMSAHDILETLREDSTLDASSATVYRALETLHEHGLVRRVDAGEGVARYEPIDPTGGAGHHHLVFEDGSVEPFSDPELAAAIDGLGARLGIEVTAHEVLVHVRRRR